MSFRLAATAIGEVSTVGHGAAIARETLRACEATDPRVASKRVGASALGIAAMPPIDARPIAANGQRH
jgi:hypothetical protein